jgi:hypothetical protein
MISGSAIILKSRRIVLGFLGLALLLPAAGPVPPSPELVKAIIVKSGPIVVEDRPGWGDTVRIFDGFQVEGKGIQARVRPRKKEVHHGLWQHYRISLRDPINDLRIEFPKLEFVTGRGVEFVIDIQARLDAYANLQQHANGLQLFAAASEGVVDVRTQLVGVVGVKLDTKGSGIELLLAPRIEKVEIGITNIDVDRFGKLRGKLVHETADSFRRLVDDLVNDKEEKVVTQINREINKRWDEGTLRVPLTTWLSRSLPSLVTAWP